MPKTLDLVGHATPASLLDLGGWVLDRCNPTVTAFFRELADHDVLPRLGISSIRLLGCGTASTQRARDTIVALTDIIGLPVLGTTSVVHAGHFRAADWHRVARTPRRYRSVDKDATGRIFDRQRAGRFRVCDGLRGRLARL